MTEIQKRLFELSDKEYAAFQAKLTPTVDKDKFIGVRVPALRKLAKEIYKTENYKAFITSYPFEYYDENMLCGLIISEIKDFDECISFIEPFFSQVDNWAVCDIMSPKVFKKNKDKLFPYVQKWSASNETYTCRFGLEMLMSHFLDEDFKPEYLEIPANVISDEYYVNMMIAWFFATALAKQWDATIPYIEQGRLSKWTHNKTIQKSKESYRITPQKKQYINGLKKV